MIGILAMATDVFPPPFMFLWFFLNVVMMSCCPRHQVRRRDRKMKNRELILQNAFAELNTQFSSRQIVWKAGDFGGWIQLNLNYSEQMPQ